MKLGSKLLPVHDFTSGRRLLTGPWFTFSTLSRGILEDEMERDRKREAVMGNLLVMHIIQYYYSMWFVADASSYQYMGKKGELLNSPPCMVSAEWGEGRRWHGNVKTGHSCWYCQHCETEHHALSTPVSILCSYMYMCTYCNQTCTCI